MIIVLQCANNQMQSMINQFGTFKTRGELGRSAFWIWYDIMRNEIKSVNVKEAKKVDKTSYRFSMKYWGDILFDIVYIRNQGKFAGYNILITGFNFDEENFYNWLQHEAPIEHNETTPNIPDTRYKPKDIKFGFTKIKAKSGLWAIADSNGNPISNEWFKDISTMRKTSNGEIATIVNRDGMAFAYYPNRDEEDRMVDMKRSYNSTIGESVFHITQSDIRLMVESAVQEVLNKQKCYTTRRIGKYTIVYGDNQPHSIEGLEKYGNNLYDVAMYNSKDEHICAFSIGQNSNRFICCNLEYDKDYGEWLGFTPIKYYNVPTLIRQDLRERFTNS